MLVARTPPLSSPLTLTLALSLSPPPPSRSVRLSGSLAVEVGADEGRAGGGGIGGAAGKPL